MALIHMVDVLCGSIIFALFEVILLCLIPINNNNLNITTTSNKLIVYIDSSNMLKFINIFQYYADIFWSKHIPLFICLQDIEDGTQL